MGLRRALARPGAAAGIHLSWSEDPSSTLTVSWHTPTRHNPAEVTWRAGDGDAPRRSVGTSRRLPGSHRWLHRVVLRDLRPGTIYHYRISSDHGVEDGPEDWTPVRTPDRDGPYRVVFLCDVGLSGRADGTTRATPRVLREIAAEEPLFYLGGGDYAYLRRDRRFRHSGEAIDRWFEQMQPLLSRAPFMAQYGNHEVELDEPITEWEARFAHPPGTPDGRSYVFDVGPARFVGLFAPGRAPAPEHLDWLRRVLSCEAARRAAWRIVFQHAPVFASGSSHPARPELSDLMPLFEQLAVDLHLSGHDQSYERTHPLNADGISKPLDRRDGTCRYASGRGVVYAKVSPAGKLSERAGVDFSRFRAEAGAEIGARDDRAHHWARLRVDSRELEVEILGLADETAAVRVVDRFSLLRTTSAGGDDRGSTEAPGATGRSPGPP